MIAQAYALQTFKDPTNHEAAQKAERYFKEALTIGNEAHIHAYYAGFLYAQNRSAESIVEWECALQSSQPNEATAPRVLAMGSVIPCIQEEITFFSVFVSTPQLMSHCSLVFAYQQQNNRTQAEAHLHKLTEAIKSCEPLHNHYSLLGYAHKALGNTQESYEAFKKACEIFPTQPYFPEYTLAKKNMLEQEQLLVTQKSSAPPDPSSSPSNAQSVWHALSLSIPDPH